MEIKTEVQEGKTITSVSGRLDAATVQAFDAQCADILKNDAPAALIMDLQNLEYVSSAGLRSLLGIYRHISAANGKMVICGANSLVKDVLSMAGFTSFLKLYESRDKALESFR